MAKSKLVKANEKIADAFVDRYLTRDGETVEDAKARLNAEEEVRRKAAKADQETRQQSSNEIMQESLKRAHERSHK